VNKVLFSIGIALLVFSEYASAQKDYAIEIIFFTPSEIQQPYEELPSLEAVPSLAKGIDLESLRRLLLKKSEQKIFKEISALPPQPSEKELSQIADSETASVETVITPLEEIPVNRHTPTLHQLPTIGLSSNSSQTPSAEDLHVLEIIPALEIPRAILEPLPIDLAENFEVALPKLEAPEAFGQWLPLATDDQQLGSLVEKLEEKAEYRVLHHMAWRQPASDASNSQSILVRAGFHYQQDAVESNQTAIVESEVDNEPSDLLGAEKLNQPKSPEVVSIALDEPQVIDFDATEHTGLLHKSYDELSALATLNADTDVIHELEGSLKVEVGRYLHLYTDLVFRIEQIEGSHEQQVSCCIAAMDDFRIKNHHRMRSRQIYYLDHPLLGILVQATPISEPKPAKLLSEPTS